MHWSIAISSYEHISAYHDALLVTALHSHWNQMTIIFNLLNSTSTFIQTSLTINMTSPLLRRKLSRVMKVRKQWLARVFRNICYGKTICTNTLQDNTNLYCTNTNENMTTSRNSKELFSPGNINNSW